MTFFVLVLILSEGQAGETWENKKITVGFWGAFDATVIFTFHV
jgi:hypothetical protein